MSHLMLDPPCPKADQAEEYKTTYAAGERDRKCQPVQHLALPKQHDSAVPHDKGCDQLVSHKSPDIKFLICLMVAVTKMPNGTVDMLPPQDSVTERRGSRPSLA